MVIKAKDLSRLVALLSEGAKRFRDLEDRPIWSSYRDGPAIADFLQRSVEEIQKGTLSQAAANELWGIFAPTCDWDDCIGDCELGQQIFEAIGRDLHYEKEEADPDRQRTTRGM